MISVFPSHGVVTYRRDYKQPVFWAYYIRLLWDAIRSIREQLTNPDSVDIAAMFEWIFQ